MWNILLHEGAIHILTAVNLIDTLRGVNIAYIQE